MGAIRLFGVLQTWCSIFDHGGLRTSLPITLLTATIMGKNRKRAAPFSGLSAFVKQAFGGSSEESPAESSKAMEVPPAEDDDGDDEPPPKRPRMDDLSTQRESTTHGSQWIAKYDATGIVDHYEDPSEVPDHLRKC